jgi:hypothetical protein
LGELYVGKTLKSKGEEGERRGEGEGVEACNVQNVKPRGNSQGQNTLHVPFK